jgi:hypothetical protein
MASAAFMKSKTQRDTALKSHHFFLIAEKRSDMISAQRASLVHNKCALPS